MIQNQGVLQRNQYRRFQLSRMTSRLLEHGKTSQKGLTTGRAELEQLYFAFKAQHNYHKQLVFEALYKSKVQASLTCQKMRPTIYIKRSRIRNKYRQRDLNPIPPPTRVLIPCSVIFQQFKLSDSPSPQCMRQMDTFRLRSVYQTI